MLEVANDIAIGDHTFTAARLQSTKLKEGRVPIVGIDGVLVDTDRVTYTISGPNAGVLTIPVLKTSALAGDVDAKGYEVRNAVLVNAKLVDTSVQGLDIVAKSISVPDLLSVPMLGTDSKGRLISANSGLIVRNMSVTEAFMVTDGGSIILEGLKDDTRATTCASADGASASSGSSASCGARLLKADDTGAVVPTTGSEVLSGFTLNRATLTSATIVINDGDDDAKAKVGGKVMVRDTLVSES